MCAGFGDGFRATVRRDIIPLEVWGINACTVGWDYRDSSREERERESECVLIGEEVCFVRDFFVAFGFDFLYVKECEYILVVFCILSNIIL